MKFLIAVSTLALCACTVGPLGKSTAVDAPACVAACIAQNERCPQMFNAFPERGAIECPAAQHQCLRACERSKVVAAAVPVAPAPSEPAAVSRVSKETRLRELKRFHDEGLITDDVYRERQTAIVSEW
jgi:hypothetical protein